MDYYMDDGDPMEGFVIERADTTFDEVLHNCMIPSLEQLYDYIEVMLFYSLLFRLIGHLGLSFGKPTIIHIGAVICGNLTLIHILGKSAVYCVLFITCNYALLIVLCYCLHVKRIGYIMGFFCMAILTTCEVMKIYPIIWHQIRGIQMVAAMKIVSLAFDLNASSKEMKTSPPGLMEFLGYMFCPANCVLGPWVSFERYKMTDYAFTWNLKWLLWTTMNTAYAISFAMLSNCLVPVIVSDNSWKWLVAYRTALSFRCSHYFVSYLSQATMATSGLANDKDKNHSIIVGFEVVKPWCIEAPRSLTEVVTNWNIPMHHWLKHYVFQIVRPHSLSLAIFITYLVSALLHGMNLQLGLILLSLGWYTFIEHKLRSSAAELLSGCIKTDSCKPRCKHELKWTSPLVLLVNLFFTILAIVHLAYLGSMFESSTSVQEDGYSLTNVISKWAELDYCSHWIALGSYVFYLLLKI